MRWSRMDLGASCTCLSATVWASSLDGAPLVESSRILLTHLTNVQNSGTKYADEALTILLDWGRLPHLMRRGTAEIELRVAPGDWKVRRLSPSGRVLGEIPSRYSDGVLRFTAKTAWDETSATYLYELSR